MSTQQQDTFRQLASVFVFWAEDAQGDYEQEMTPHEFQALLNSLRAQEEAAVAEGQSPNCYSKCKVQLRDQRGVDTGTWQRFDVQSDGSDSNLMVTALRYRFEWTGDAEPDQVSMMEAAGWL